MIQLALGVLAQRGRRLDMAESHGDGDRWRHSFMARSGEPMPRLERDRLLSLTLAFITPVLILLKN